MTEFGVPDEITLDAAADLLARHLGARDGTPRKTVQVFYDTFDGLLYGEGLSLVHVDQELLLRQRESGEVRAWTQCTEAQEHVLVSQLPEGSLRARLEPVVGVRALLAKAKVSSLQRRLDVLDGEQKTVMRLTLEQPAVLTEGRSTKLQRRLEIHPLRGYRDELTAVSEAVVRDCRFKPVAIPLVDGAIAALGAPPAGTPSKVHVPLEYDQRADAAAAAVCGALLRVIEANLKGVIDDLDSEFLHDLRVSVRRTRTVQRQLKKVFPAGALQQARGEFRWLQRTTGEARDLDVYVLSFDSLTALVSEEMRGDLDPLLGMLEARRRAAHRQVKAALRSRRARSALSQWSRLLGALEGSLEGDRPRATEPIGALAGARIRKLYKRMVKLGGTLTTSSPSAEYHELRKQGKELRYMLELFGSPLFAEDAVKPMIKSLKDLQDVLGRHQDREVQGAMLRSLGEEVARSTGGARTAMAIGALIERVWEDELLMREQFGKRFEPFASSSQRMLIRKTFA